MPGRGHVCVYRGAAILVARQSLGYQSRGADVIGVAGATEAKLAREAEISYATVAMVTDYDCWHEEHDAVDVAAVVKVMADNADKASALVARTLRDFPAVHEACPAGSDRWLGRCHHHPCWRPRSGAGEEARRGRRTRAPRRVNGLRDLASSP